MRKIPRRSSSTSKRAQKDSKHKGWTSCPAPGSNWWPSGYESDALTNWASRARAYIWCCQKEILSWLWKLGVILASLDKWPPGNKIWLDGLLGAVDDNQTPDTKNSKSGTFSAFLPSSITCHADVRVPGCPCRLSRSCWNWTTVEQQLQLVTSDPAQKSGQLQAKIAFFLFFRRRIWHDFVTPFSTFANRNIKAGSLATNSTTPIDCDAGPEQTVKIFPVFGQFFLWTSSKKGFKRSGI